MPVCAALLPEQVHILLPDQSIHPAMAGLEALLTGLIRVHHMVPSAPCGAYKSSCKLHARALPRLCPTGSPLANDKWQRNLAARGPYGTALRHARYCGTCIAGR